MKVSELMQVMDTMKDVPSDKINQQLSGAANNTLGIGSSIAAGKMEDALGRDVSADEAQQTAQSARHLINNHFDGDAHAAMRFLKETNERCPALGQYDVAEFAEAAGQLKEMKDANSEQYAKLLEDAKSNPELLASLQNNPGQVIAAYKNNTSDQIQIAKNDSEGGFPDTQDRAFPETSPEEIAHKDPELLAELTDFLSEGWHAVAGNILPEDTLELGDELIADIMAHVFEQGSEVIGNAPGMIENVAENLALECKAIRLDPDTGSEIAVAQNTLGQIDPTAPAAGMTV